MQYMGGKTRLAKDINALIQQERKGRDRYIEPFVGGASVFSVAAPSFSWSACGDACPDLVLMWQAAAAGWVPPTTVTEQEYATLKRAESSALRGFVGFACSFGAKWFGGYARNRAGTNYADQGSRAVARKAAVMRPGLVFCRGYGSWDVSGDCVVYCDPPYAGTQPYGAVNAFNHVAFWDNARRWADSGAAVLVSEYQAPDGWSVIYEKGHIQQLNGTGDRRPTVERVFMLR